MAGWAMKWLRNRSSCSIIARSSGCKITPAARSFSAEHIALEQLVVGEDQPARESRPAGGAIEQVARVVFGRWPRQLIRRKIERLRHWKNARPDPLRVGIGRLLEFRPGRLLLLAEPSRQIALRWRETGENGARLPAAVEAFLRGERTGCSWPAETRTAVRDRRYSRLKWWRKLADGAFHLEIDEALQLDASIPSGTGGRDR